MAFILISGFLIGGSVLFADRVDGQDSESLAAIPSPVKVSPKRKGDFYPYGLFYNPTIDRYVVFLMEAVSNREIILYSRLFNRKGRPASGFQKVFQAHRTDVGFLNIAYNQQDNVFFVVGCDSNFDEIKGILCDGEGRWLNPEEEGVIIKGESGILTGFVPQVTWIPSTNQYAVNWTLVNYRKPEDFRNGQFLSVLNSDLSFKVKKRKVRKQTMKNNWYYAKILPLEDKLLWTTTQDAQGMKLQPVVWFTNLKGKILNQYGDEGDGFIYPHPAVDGRGRVSAAYNDVEDTIFLYWDQSNSDYSDQEAYREHRFRLMDSNGEFKGPWMIVPRKYPYQNGSSVSYNPVENRFFWITSEYRILSSSNPYRSNVRGKLWGFYVGNDGNFESKTGKQLWRPIALTRYFSSMDISMDYAGCAYNDSRNEYFILYVLYDYKSESSEIWSILYK